MKITAAIVLVCALALCVSAADSSSSPCYAKITWKARSDQYSSWMIGATTYQIYDVIATNEGSCSLTSILALFSAADAGGFVSEGWNYDITTGIFSGYGGILQVGQSFYGAGFVLANSTQPMLSLTQPTCDSSCAAATTSAPTSAPSTNAPSTSMPTTSMPTTTAPGSSSCNARITWSARSDQYSSWMIGATHYQIFDIIITNQGTCNLTSILALFSASEAGGFISEGWNYDITTGMFSGYGNNLQVGQSFYGAGIVLANASQPMLGATQPTCESSCAAPTGSPTTSMPTTSMPTTSMPTTSMPTTSMPTTSMPTTAAPNSCTATASVARDGNSWTDSQGRSNAVYRLTINNAGQCALSEYVVSFDFGSGTLISNWNLVSVQGGYRATGFGSQLAPGASNSASGLILAGAPDNISATTYSSKCAC